MYVEVAVMIQSSSPSAATTAAGSAQGPARLIRFVVAAAIVGGPLGYLVGSALHPPVQPVGEGGSTIAANAGTDPIVNGAHLVAYVVAAFLLPIGVAGMGYLAYRPTPWLATIGGLLGVAGWLPFAALTALDDLARTMADLPDSGRYAELYSRFETSPVMLLFLLVYVVAHLVAYVLLGVALMRARVVPRWAAWSLIASSPVTMAGFVLPGRPVSSVGIAGLALLLLGSLPASRAMLRQL
jgi:multidrug transporter EmrE-like cation transporter